MTKVDEPVGNLSRSLPRSPLSKLLSTSPSPSAPAPDGKPQNLPRAPDDGSCAGRAMAPVPGDRRRRRGHTGGGGTGTARRQAAGRKRGRVRHRWAARGGAPRPRGLKSMRRAGRYCFTAIHANIALSTTKWGFGLMAKGPESATGRLSALVAEIEAEAYARGRADARKEIRAALGAAVEPAPRPRRGSPRAAGPARKSRASGGNRAPRGSTRALVERALRDRPGLTAREILNCATTDAERLVKLASIRVELHTGRRQGRYESKDGRWSLAASATAVDDSSPDASAASTANVSEGTPGDSSPSEADPSREPGEAASAPTGDTPDGDSASGEPATGAGQGRLGMNW